MSDKKLLFAHRRFIDAALVKKCPRRSSDDFRAARRSRLNASRGRRPVAALLGIKHLPRIFDTSERGVGARGLIQERA